MLAMQHVKPTMRIPLSRWKLADNAYTGGSGQVFNGLLRERTTALGKLAGVRPLLRLTEFFNTIWAPRRGSAGKLPA